MRRFRIAQAVKQRFVTIKTSLPKFKCARTWLVRESVIEYKQAARERGWSGFVEQFVRNVCATCEVETVLQSMERSTDAAEHIEDGMRNPRDQAKRAACCLAYKVWRSDASHVIPFAFYDYLDAIIDNRFSKIAWFEILTELLDNVGLDEQEYFMQLESIEAGIDQVRVEYEELREEFRTLNAKG